MKLKEGQFVVVTQGAHQGQKGFLSRAQNETAQRNGCFWLVTSEGPRFVWTEQLARYCDLASHLLERMREIWSCQGLFRGGVCGAERAGKKEICERFPHVNGPHEATDEDGCLVVWAPARCRWTVRRSYSNERVCWECGGVGQVALGPSSDGLSTIWRFCQVCERRGVLYAEHEAPFFEVKGEFLAGFVKGNVP